MASTVQLVNKADGTLLLDLNDPTGVNNAAYGSVQTGFGLGGSFSLARSTSEIAYSAPLNRSGGRTIRRREPLLTSSFRLFAKATSFDNWMAFYGRLAALLQRTDGSVSIKWIPDGSTRTRYLDLEACPIPTPYEGTEFELNALYKQFQKADGVEIQIVHQPLLRGDLVDSDVNLLGNPSLTLDVPGTGYPDMWAWDNKGSITLESIDPATESYTFTIATTATRNLQQRVANFAQNDIAAFKLFEVKASAAGVVQVEAVVAYLDSADVVVGSETVSAQVPVGTSWVPVSVTKGAAGANTVRARVSIRFRNAAATATKVYMRKTQLEKAAASTDYRVSTQRVINEPADVAYDHVSELDFSVALGGVGAGNVNTGAHKYSVTYVTEDGETRGDNAAATWPTATTSAGDGTVDVTGIPVGGAGVIARRIYRTTAGTSTFGLLTTLYGAETSYHDNIADASLGAVPPTISGVYLPGKMLPVYANGDAETPLIATADLETGVYASEFWLSARGNGGSEGGRGLIELLGYRGVLRSGDLGERNPTGYNDTALQQDATSSGLGAFDFRTGFSGETDKDDPSFSTGGLLRRIAWVVPAGRNVLAGPSSNFETSSGWQASGTNCTTARSTAIFRTGKASLAITGAATAAMEAFPTDAAGASPITPGQVVSASVWLRTQATARSCSARITFYDSGLTLLSTVAGTAANDSTAWQQRSVTAIAPASAAYARLGVFFSSTILNEIHYVDDAWMAVGVDPSALESYEGTWEAWIRYWGGRDAAQFRWGAAFSGRAQNENDQVILDIPGTRDTGKFGWASLGRLSIPDVDLQGLAFEFWARRDAQGSATLDVDYIWLWPAESSQSVLATGPTQTWLGSELTVTGGIILGAEAKLDSASDTAATSDIVPTEAGRHRVVFYLRGDDPSATVTATCKLRNVTDSTDAVTFTAKVRGSAVVALEGDVTAAAVAAGKHFQGQVIWSAGTVWVTKIVDEIPLYPSGERILVDPEADRYERQGGSSYLRSTLQPSGAGVVLSPGYNVLAAALFESINSGANKSDTHGPKLGIRADVIQRSFKLRTAYYPRFWS